MELLPPNTELANGSSIQTQDDVRSIKTFDEYLRYTEPIGSVAGALSRNLKGLNLADAPVALAEERENMGFVFFTRPQLNLRSNNIRNIPDLSFLNIDNDLSVYRYIRCMLDPRLETGDFGEKYRSRLLDNEMAFIPILTNAVKTVSGWPDSVTPSFVNNKGIRGEEYGFIDGTSEINGKIDLDITFKNVRSKIIPSLFKSWTKYGSAVFEGTMTPYMSSILEDEIDYATRIYRVVLSEDRKYVSQIAAIGYGYPVTVPDGKSFDYTSEKAYLEQNSEITIRFECYGVYYNDPRIIRAFNDAVGIFNPLIRGYRTTGKLYGMEKVPTNLLALLNYAAYPYINPKTYELEWYAKTEEVAALRRSLALD